MKRALVIGGSGQLGQVLCRALHAADARVAFTYFKSETAARALQSELGCDALQLDLRELSAIGPALLGLAEGLGGVDCLIHAATVSSTLNPPTFDRLEDATVDGFQELMAINVGSAFFACQALARALGETRGNIVLLGSVDGIKPVPSPPPYAVSKAALKGLALSLCKALGPSGVCVNVVAPGVLERGASHTLPEGLRAEYLKHCGLKRVGSLEEAANLVCWLGLHNTYITGQTLMVDGGL
ncbi:MAG: SDR family oxidoreductase [Polyangiaceae bacterium]